MPTNKQRRDAARRHLERQLQRRQERAATRRRFTLVGSIVGTVVLVVAVVVTVVLVSGGGKKSTAADSPTVSSPTASPTPTPTPTPSTSYPAAKGPSVTFDGVTVKGATDLHGKPGVTSKASAAPKALEYKDLVVGKGAAATATSNVTVQYVGVLYKNGTLFDASWTRGMPATFSLNGGVIKGFQYGIGGTKGVPPMRVGGRRVIILPASLGYGSQSLGPIPANSSLV
ncbi:MAG TPA: FKBP-type peptidyl-prolyl cis-trans isomerase, partial [Jatrophihabitantaceae bacterium]|nr:FKBP-type peptidyl-prolyl cis-trans isomerase [Jatrophihabitantaceae bacterium]